MSELLLSWLNDEIQLSRRVSDFEEDFHNGFLLCELMCRYNQQLNEGQYHDRDDKATRISNFALLLDICRALKVTFDSNVAMRIMNREYGHARKLLYELKSQLQKMGKTSHTALKRIQPAKEKYDQVNREHFLKQLNQLHPAQKEILQQAHLHKFNDFQEKAMAKTMNLDEKDKQNSLLKRNKFIQQQKNNIKKSELFRKQWEESHQEKWQNNLLKRKNQVQKDITFKSNLNQTQVQSHTTAQINALKSLQRDIAQFEKKNLNSSDSDEEGEVKEAKQITKPLLEQSLKKKRVPVTDEKAKHQRQKRRRKTIVEQSKRCQLIQISRRERYIVATIEQNSKQEKQIQYQIWRAWQNKQIIIQNKQLKVQKEKEKLQTREMNAQFKSQELLKCYREEHTREMKDAIGRFGKAQINAKVKQRKQNYKKCNTIVEQLLNITEQLYLNQQNRNKNQLDQTLSEKLFAEFMVPSQSLFLQDYIHGHRQWNISLKGQEPPQPTEPTEENALPLNIINNYYLGNTLKYLYQLHSNKKINQVESKEQSPSMVFVLLGFQFAGKGTVAANIIESMEKEVGPIAVILIQKLIQQKMNENKEINNLALTGKSIPQQLLTQLVCEQISKHKHCILMDYPKTYTQAVRMTKSLAGIEAKTKETKHQFSRLVQANGARVRALQRRYCGIDCLVWLSTSIEQSLDRMLGRRWVGEEMHHINNAILNLDQIQCGPKASALVMQNSFKALNISSVERWFSHFGNQQESCWHRLAQALSEKDTLQQTLNLFKQAVIQKQKRAIEREKQKEIAALQQKKIQEQIQERENISKKCVYTPPQQLKIELETAISKVSLPQLFVSKIISLWEQTQRHSVDGLNRALNLIDSQLGRCYEYSRSMKHAFISLLTREDPKMHLIKTFQMRYNSFLKQNHDMISNDYAKEQLQQKADDLYEKLMEIVEEKKEDAIGERESIMGSNWVNFQYDQTYEAVYIVLQTELTKYFASEKILADFYSKKYNTPPKEQQIPVFELVKDNTLEAISQGTFPRLDKMISQAIRLFNREQEVVDDKNKKGAKIKKQEKKAAKKAGKQEVVKQSEPTLQQLELKKAINTQKAIFRYRVAALKEFASKRLLQLHQIAESLYRQLQDLYLYTYKAQKTSISNVTNIFRSHIEQERAIENEIQIDSVLIIRNDNIRNFQRESPKIEAATEQLRPNRFTVTNIHYMMKLLQNQAQGRCIPSKKLLYTLQTITEHKELKDHIPEVWKTLSKENIQHFVQKLDQGKGYVSLAQIFVFILLSDAPVPNLKQLQEYRLGLSEFGANKQVKKEKMISTAAWFDTKETAAQCTLSPISDVKVFERTKYIKQILFDIFKQGETIDINAFLTSIGLIEFNIQEPIEKTYFQYAFK